MMMSTPAASATRKRKRGTRRGTVGHCWTCNRKGLPTQMQVVETMLPNLKAFKFSAEHIAALKKKGALTNQTHHCGDCSAPRDSTASVNATSAHGKALTEVLHKLDSELGKTVWMSPSLLSPSPQRYQSPAGISDTERQVSPVTLATVATGSQPTAGELAAPTPVQVEDESQVCAVALTALSSAGSSPQALNLEEFLSMIH